MSKKRVVLLEDDWIQRKWIVDRIEERFGATVDVYQVRTESEFAEQFEDIATMKPSALIVDVMLKYSDTLIEEGVEGDDYTEAGIRCLKRLNEDSRTKDIPTLVFTVLDRHGLNLPDRVEFRRKDTRDKSIISWLRSVLGGTRSVNENDRSATLSM